MVTLRLLVVSLLFSGCATAIPYAVQPSRITDPAVELKSLILSNTNQGCITEPSVAPKMLSVKFVCGASVGNVAVRFDRIQLITLDKSMGWYRIKVQHTEGVEDFWWSSKSLEDMQRMADAITALSTSLPAPPATSTTKL